MLILTRRPGESIVIDGRIVIKFLGHRDPKHQSPIKLCISAPKDVKVMRQELLALGLGVTLYPVKDIKTP